MKITFSKEKVACPRSQQLRWHAIFKLCEWISSEKSKKFAKPFLSVHLGPRSNLLSKKKCENPQKCSHLGPRSNRLSIKKLWKISWHCPFNNLNISAKTNHSARPFNLFRSPGGIDSWKKAIQVCDKASLIDLLYIEWILISINNMNYHLVIFILMKP